jgi:site-specific recombinase
MEKRKADHLVEKTVSH